MTRNEIRPLLYKIIAIVLCIGIMFCMEWARCGVQSNIYHREGIEISQWEIFFGGKPQEQNINLKESK